MTKSTSVRSFSATDEVVIIGGGLVGCASALRLRDAGARVTVLEKSVPGAEASSAAAGILAGQVEARTQGPLFEAGLASRALHAALADELRARCGLDVGYAKCGAAELCFDEATLHALAASVRWQRDRGLPVEVLDRRALSEQEPGAPSNAVGAVFFPDDAQVDPPRLVSAVAQAAERAGVRFRSGSFVRRVVVENGRVAGVELDDGRISAEHVVVAAGAWSSLVEGAGIAANAVRPARGQLMELRARVPPAKSVLYGHGGYVVPRADGRVVVGSTLEFVGFRSEVTAAGLAKILATATGIVPALEHAVFTRAWASFRPYTPDGAPLVGGAGIEGLTVATGHHRSGILLAPWTAERVAAHVLGRDDASLVRELDPRRETLAR